MKRIAYLGPTCSFSPDTVWGGYVTTTHAYLTAFANDPEWKIDPLPSKSMKSVDEINAFCRGADLVHLDHAPMCGMMFKDGAQQPDIIGPMIKSPIKNYTGWTCPYTPDWFYRARVIRLNYQEEHHRHDLVTLVVHGVPTDMLTPANTPQADRNLILWAGKKERFAKNYQLWEEVQKAPLENGYQYKTLLNYHVRDYWQALDTAAVVVVTSRYESFCSAAFQAMSKGVPVVWKKDLQGGPWEDAGIRCEYSAMGFRQGTQEALDGGISAGKDARQYVIDHCSLKHMRESYAKVFKEVLNEKTA